MKNSILTLTLILTVTFAGCDKDMSDATFSDTRPDSSQGNSGSQSQQGVITAGEWNDLENWVFWDTIIHRKDYNSIPAFWNIYNRNRISVNILSSDSAPIADVPVKLKNNGITIFNGRSDNRGNVELWVGLFDELEEVDFSDLTLDINNGAEIRSNILSFNEGINKVILPINPELNNIELAFVVDATSSMSDELEYLKVELYDVISRAKNDNPAAILSTASVFYRDASDEYVTKISHFTNDNILTTNFIKEQRAEGGGDFPEAVHSALAVAVDDLQWSEKAKTRLLFLILDAPPHHEYSVINSIQASIKKAAEKGIKIIPITASGIDKETEFLMRFLSISTNGTYVFITNHSGIGNDHLEATVGEYQVEFLNNLMVRLINKYA